MTWRFFPFYILRIIIIIISERPRHSSMNPTPVSKNCQAFMNKIYQSRHWETIKGMLLQWRDQQKEIVPGMDTFKQIMRTLEAGENPDEKIIDSFNRCLVKDAQIVKKIADEYIDD